MGQWISGNIPEYTSLFHWITIKGGTANNTYPLPCKYDAKKDAGQMLKTHNCLPRQL